MEQTEEETKQEVNKPVQDVQHIEDPFDMSVILAVEKDMIEAIWS